MNYDFTWYVLSKTSNIKSYRIQSLLSHTSCLCTFIKQVKHNTLLELLHLIPQHGQVIPRDKEQVAVLHRERPRVLCCRPAAIDSWQANNVAWMVKPRDMRAKEIILVAHQVNLTCQHDCRLIFI